MFTPYQVGGSLHNNNPTYVVRSCDHELYKALKSGEFCYIFNSRQMGKSSLIVRTKYQLETEGYRCTVVDMTQIGSQDTTPSQWYKGVAIDLLRGFGCIDKLNFKTWWQEQEGMPLSQILSELIEELLLRQFPEENLCIFIDEIDSILSLNFPIDDFFALIRYCYNQRAISPKYKRLTFVLCGVATPSNLMRDKTRTPFNLGTAIDLEGFTLEESQPLVQGLVGQIDNPELILKEILNWTNGQPFLTQKLLRLVIFNLNKIEPAFQNSPTLWIQKLVQEQIIKHWQSQDEPEHLRTISDRLLYKIKYTPRLLGTYKKILQGLEVYADESIEQSELLLSGLVIKNQEILKVKNKIYQQVFDLNWVEEKLGKLRPYSQMFEAWVVSGQQDQSRLLRGKALKDAQLWSQGKSLSNLDYEFLAASTELERREIQLVLEAERTKAVEAQLAEQQKRLVQEQKNTQLQRLFSGAISIAFLVASGLGLFAFQQYQEAQRSNREARLSEIKALASSSKGLFASHHQLDAMIAAIKAKRKLDDLRNVDAETQENVEVALRQTVYGNNEFNRLIGHQGSVLSVDISPDDQWIATGSNDKTVKLWNRDGTLFKTLPHKATVHRVIFSPDSRLVLSSGLDGTLKLWRVIDGTLVKTIQAHSTQIWGVAFSPDGQLLASASGDKTVKLWRLDGTLWKTLIGHQLSVWNVAFSPDGQRVASASMDRTVKLWGVDGRLLKTLQGHQNAVWDVTFCSQGDFLVSVSSDNTAKFWNLDGRLIRTLTGTHAILGVDCQGQFIATSGRDNQVKIWEIDGTFIRDLQRHRAVIRDVALSSNGLMLASASDDGTVKLWQRNQYLLKPLYGHQDTVWEIATSADGQLLASVSADQSLKLWRTDGTFLQNLQPQEWGFRSVEFHPNRSMMVTGSNNGKVEIWKLGKQEQSPITRFRTLTGHQAGVYALAISPDGRTIASGGDDQTIKIWTFAGQLLHSIPAHRERIWELVFSPDGQLLASASEEGTVKLWKPNGKAVKTLMGHQGPVWGLAFSPQGNLLVSVSQDDVLTLWKTDGTLLKTIKANSHGLTRVAFSPDGQTIATGGYDNQVKLWNLDGKLLNTLPGHQGTVTRVVFTADGNFLVSGEDNGMMILWDLKKIRILNELDYACNWVKDYLRTNLEVEESDRHLCD